MLATAVLLSELSEKSLSSVQLDALYNPELDVRVNAAEMTALENKCSWCQEQSAKGKALVIYPSTNFSVSFLLSGVRLVGKKLLGRVGPKDELVRLNDAPIYSFDRETGRYSVYNDRY